MDNGDKVKVVASTDQMNPTVRLARLKLETKGQKMPEPLPLTISVPIEIYGVIFNKLRQNEVLNFRLVCHDWKEEIDHHYKYWNVRLDDRAPAEVLNHILGLPIAECTLFKLLNPLPPNPHLQRPAIFQYPNHIRVLKMRPPTGNEHEENEDDENRMRVFSLISPENLHFILKACSKGLKSFLFAGTSETLENSCSLKELMCYDFRNLEKLEIHYSLLDGWMPDGPIELHDDYFLHQIITFPLPKLKSFEFHYEKTMEALAEEDKCKILHDLLNFIIHHGQLLKSVSFNIAWTTGLYSVTVEPSLDFEGLGPVDPDLLKRTDSLEFLHLDFDSIQFERSNWMSTAWGTLIRTQRKLVKLELIDMNLSEVDLGIIISQNCETLTHIQIRKMNIIHRVLLNGKRTRVLDLHPLESCEQLQELKISPEGPEITEDRNAVFRNLVRLPMSLQELTFMNVDLYSADLLDFVQTHKSLCKIGLVGGGFALPEKKTKTSQRKSCSEPSAVLGVSRSNSGVEPIMEVETIGKDEMEIHRLLTEKFDSFKLKQNKREYFHYISISLKRDSSSGCGWEPWDPAPSQWKFYYTYL